MAERKRSSRRGQNEGSIYRRTDGRWTAAISLGYRNGKLSRKYFYGKTRKEASDKLTEELERQRKGIPAINERTTMKDSLESWLAAVKSRVRDLTYTSYEHHVKAHILPILGKHRLTKLVPQHIQSFLDAKLESGLSATTVRYQLKVMRMALKQAIRWNLLHRNVAELVDPPKTTKYEVDPITPEQARTFLKASAGGHLEEFFAVALALGLRRGEALGLAWKDVDLENRMLRVRRSLQRLNGRLVLSEPKTKSSIRVLDLPDALVSKLREHRKRQNEQRMAAGPEWKETGLVFTTSKGTPCDPRNVKRYLDGALKKAGLPHYRIHDLRHFSASLMLAQGVPLKVVSEILGHSRISITADLYTHVLPAQKREVSELMNSILTGTNQ